MRTRLRQSTLGSDSGIYDCVSLSLRTQFHQMSFLRCITRTMYLLQSNLPQRAEVANNNKNANAKETSLHNVRRTLRERERELLTGSARLPANPKWCFNAAKLDSIKSVNRKQFDRTEVRKYCLPTHSCELRLVVFCFHFFLVPILQCASIECAICAGILCMKAAAIPKAASQQSDRIGFHFRLNLFNLNFGLNILPPKSHTRK